MNFTKVSYLRRTNGNTGLSITFLVSGWFCEVGGCGKKGTVKEFIKISNVQEEAEHSEKGLLDILVVLLN